MDLSLVIACYNDGAHLEAHLCEIESVLNQTRYSYELILIDDSSPDGSATTVETAANRRANATCILHEKNVGRGGTVAEGMRLATGTYTGFLDIDLEVHCRYIPAMLLALEQGYDGATAFRVYKMRWNVDFFLRHILSVGYRWMVRSILQLPYDDTETGYKFFNREKITPLLDKTGSTGWFWDTEIMAQCHYHGMKLIEIPALFIRNNEKASTVKPFRDSMNYLRELYRFRKRLNQDGNV